METQLLATDYDMHVFLSQLLQDPTRLPAYIWDLEKISVACAQRIARLSKQTNSMMIEKLASVTTLRTELTQKMRQLDRVQTRLQKIQSRICQPYAQVMEGTEQYERLLEVSEKLKDLQSFLTKMRRGDVKGAEELAKGLQGVEAIEKELKKTTANGSK